MASRTKRQLAKAVMQKLALLDANAEPSSADYAMVAERYVELLDSLRDENLAYWDDDDAIPLLVFPALTDLVALHCMGAFGLGGSVVEIEDAEIPIKRRMRRHTKKNASGEEQGQDHF